MTSPSLQCGTRVFRAFKYPSFLAQCTNFKLNCEVPCGNYGQAVKVNPK